MPELLVRVTDKVNSNDVYKNAHCTKRGDVIVVVPDGHAWGKEELSNPFWRIIACPDISMEDAEAFLTKEPGDLEINPMLQARAFRIDFDHPLMAAVKAEIDGPRVRRVPASRAVVMAAKRQRPALPNPFSIGPENRFRIG